MKLLRRVLLALLLAVLLLPPLQVLAVRWAPPLLTWTMVDAALTYDRWPTRHWRSLESLGEAGPRAMVAAEDARFWLHDGFDWEGICRAVEKNADRDAGDRRVGGSSITQQTARTVFLWQDQGWVRKALEAWYTLWMELLLPKERILELYVNSVEIGIGQFGLEAGARYYYGVHAGQLDAEQAARLASLLPSPRRWELEDAHVRRKAAWVRQHPAPWPGEPGYDEALRWWRQQGPRPADCLPGRR